MEIETEGMQSNRMVSIPDRWDIVNLRKEGHTYSKIGESVGRSASTCKDIISDGKKEETWRIEGALEDPLRLQRKRRKDFSPL